MSNYALQAELNRLERELSAIQAENNRLRAEISETIGHVNAADNELTQCNNRIVGSLTNAAGSIAMSAQKTLDAYELQGTISGLYEKYKHIELANKKIRALNNKKYYDFNNYRTVRKIVQGMMDNLDLNIIGDATIYKSIEKQHLMTPNYWLTCVLISIMAWRKDDKVLADRAIARAMELDKKNCCVFYMIFNIRMGRDAAAVKWFLEYQKCELKGSDDKTFLMLFSLISKTLADTVDEETYDIVQEFLNNTILACAQREGFNENDVISMICEKMDATRERKTYPYQNLSKYMMDYETIRNMLDMSANNYNILDMVLKIKNVPVAEKNVYLKEYLNELVAKPNADEAETYEQIEYNEAIIKFQGDEAEANSWFETEKIRRESDLDIISSMIGWVYDFSNTDINGQMRLNMFTLLKTMQQKSVNAYVNAYRNMYKKVHPISILDYKTNANFEQENGEMQKVDQYYNGEMEKELGLVKNLGAYIAFGVGAACAVAGIFLHPVLLAGLAVGGIVGGVKLFLNKKQKDSIRLRFHQQAEGVKNTIHKMFAEYGAAMKHMSENDAVSQKIMEELENL